MQEIEFVLKVALALAIGGLIGLEREKAIPKPVLGLRTFALLSFLGMLSTVFSDGISYGVIGLLGVFVFALLFYYYKITHFKKLEAALGLTTALMVPFAFFLGMLVGAGRYFEAVVAAVITSVVLVQRVHVHAFVRKLSREEITDLILFAVIAFVVYPLLPMAPWSLFGVSFSLQQFWLIVILASLISFAAHVLVKFFGARAVLPSLVLGGVVSALATLALLLREKLRDGRIGSLGLFAATTGALLGDFVLLGVLSPALLSAALPPLLALFVVFAIASAFVARGLRLEHVVIARNPLSLRFVVEFAAVFFAVSLLVSYAAGAGSLSFALSSIVSGVVSASSVTASTALLFSQGKVSASSAVLALLLAQAGSMVAKFGLLGVRQRGKGMGWILLALLAGFLLSGVVFVALFRV